MSWFDQALEQLSKLQDILRSLLAKVEAMFSESSPDAVIECCPHETTSTVAADSDPITATTSPPATDITSKLPMVYPLEKQIKVNTHFAIHGPKKPGDKEPDYYVEGKYHVGVDLAGENGDAVISPVDGKIVYYSRGTSVDTEDDRQTVMVIFGNDGRSYILGHTVLNSNTGLKGADGVSIMRVVGSSVKRGESIGSLADLDKYRTDKVLWGDHLHFGIAAGNMVDENGKLRVQYEGGKWGAFSFEGAFEEFKVAGNLKSTNLIDPAVDLANSVLKSELGDK
jgi:murein DD-endopeptidase MepM/ murein hydrolase activator NlpD